MSITSTAAAERADEGALHLRDAAAPDENDERDERDECDGPSAAEAPLRISPPRPSSPASSSVGSRDGGVGGSRRPPGRRDRPPPGAEGDDALSPPPSRGKTDESGDNERARLPPALVALRHLTALVVATILLATAAHRYTYSTLRYELHYFGNYKMRGVPGFGSRSVATRTNDAAAAAAPAVDDRHDSSPRPTSETSSAAEVGAPPLMMPRELASRNGAAFRIPRGVPLPPPMLALAEVRLCGAMTSEERCLGGGGGDGGDLLECAWCSNGRGCVPGNMRGVMCGQDQI